MPRRVSLPGASELFRTTQPAEPEIPDAAGTGSPSEPAGRGSGRVRHDEKITVYVSQDELLALEQTRLDLRRLGLAVDRGRIVREAISVLLGDLEARGTESELVRRLSAAAEAGAPDGPSPEPAA